MGQDISILPNQAEETLYSDVCQIIDSTRGRIATFLNTEVCMTTHQRQSIEYLRSVNIIGTRPIFESFLKVSQSSNT